MCEESHCRKQRTQGLLPIRGGLSRQLFERLSTFIHTERGIKMPLTKKTMLEARLAKRTNVLGFTSLAEYCEYLFSAEGMGRELVHMIDAVTTNKTDFFREPQHFDYLQEYVLPELMKMKGSGIMRPFLIWSAACSSGEEPYTLAMVLDRFASRNRSFTYQIFASDISTKMLSLAREGIYSADRVVHLPNEIKRSYIMYSKDKSKGLVRIVPELRNRVRFMRINFMEDDFRIPEKMDVIFCRNVLIYFDHSTQEVVLNRICRYLHTGGYLFTGHSETINSMNLPLITVANTVSRKV